MYFQSCGHFFVRVLFMIFNYVKLIHVHRKIIIENDWNVRINLFRFVYRLYFNIYNEVLPNIFYLDLTIATITTHSCCWWSTYYIICVTCITITPHLRSLLLQCGCSDRVVHCVFCNTLLVTKHLRAVIILYIMIQRQYGNYLTQY